MDTIPTGPLERDESKFLALLSAVRDSALEDGHWKLVSISLDARTHIDPLAVLESIYEPNERHCYIEHPERGEALAGAESVIERTFSGPARFDSARDFARELFDNTVAVGQLDLPLSGPKIFCAFTFEDHEENGAATQTTASDSKSASRSTAPFAPATLFVPRWQVSASDGAYVATASLLVTPDGDIEAQARRALDAYKKFSSFSYDKPHDALETAANSTTATKVPAFNDTASATYRANVSAALEAISAGRCTKVVLARREKLHAAAPLHPLHTLARLRDRFPSCHAFSFSNGLGTSFIGATPERLVRIENGVVETEAIAGTTARGATPAEDATLASSLMDSEKQQREHRAVADTIFAQLTALGLNSGPIQRPRLLRLPNAQHIRTPFRATLTNNLHLFDIAGALHPTPATSGLPRDEAMKLLLEIEGAPRGLYAGLVGWCDADGAGEMVVALRSGEICGIDATLFAGAGIVEGSKPDEELNETKVKLSALKASIG